MRVLKPHRLAILKALILWREEQARTKNLPRGWILKDLALRDIASNPPASMGELGRIRSIGNIAQGRSAQNILDLISKAQNLPLSECPPVEPDNSEPSPSGNTIVLLRALLSHVCASNRIAPKLVATGTDLEQIALGKPGRLDLGWRKQFFGDLAQKLLGGEIALALQKGEITVVQVS